MRPVKAFLPFALILLIIACNPYSQKIEEAEKFILQLKEKGETAGLAVAVSVDSTIIFSKGFGIANLEQQVPATSNKTKFRIGSVSKALTSAAIGKLFYEGKIDLDKPVQEYVPYFPEKRWPTTVRQVGGHLAGIRHYRDNEFMLAKHFDTVREGLDIFMYDTLLSAPGERYKYSSYGWNLMSAVVEGASGENFLDYMDENIFRPLKMDNTIADINDSIIVNRSGFYSMDDGNIINAPYVDNSYKWAGGGFISTMEDIVKFGNAMLYNKIFPEKIKDTLTTTQLTNSGDETGYGIGWGTGTNKFGREFYGHGGGSVGGCGNFIVFPEEKLVIAYFTNDSRAPVGNEIHELAEIFMSDEGTKAN